MAYCTYVLCSSLRLRTTSGGQLNGIECSIYNYDASTMSIYFYNSHIRVVALLILYNALHSKSSLLCFKRL